MIYYNESAWKCMKKMSAPNGVRCGSALFYDVYNFQRKNTTGTTSKRTEIKLKKNPSTEAYFALSHSFIRTLAYIVWHCSWCVLYLDLWLLVTNDDTRLINVFVLYILYTLMVDKKKAHTQIHNKTHATDVTSSAHSMEWWLIFRPFTAP